MTNSEEATTILTQGDHDPELFHGTRGLLGQARRRRVGLIEPTGLLGDAAFFSRRVPDAASARGTWFRALLRQAAGTDLVFLDPDNGLEVKSRPYGRKGCCKFLFWHEVEGLWAAGKSLVVYQHFIREDRSAFTERMLGTLGASAPGALLEAFLTPRVLFLMALQHGHRRFHPAIIRAVQRSWGGQIGHREPQLKVRKLTSGEIASDEGVDRQPDA